MKFAILIPAFQAEKTISKLLSDIAKITTTIQDEVITIVVNDASTDSTEKIASNFPIILLKHETNKGKGAALKTGFAFAINQNVDAVLTIDADLQHEPIYIKQFINEFKKGNFDLIIGNRINRFTNMPIHRQLSNLVTSFLVTAKTKIKIPDSQSGYRIITTKILETISLNHDGFILETELLINAARSKFKISSIPISTIYSNNKSHMTNWKSTIEFIKLIISE
ncbi:MAG: glycosyltransferase family 2 protein [Ignavibacteria bacterium]|nr:glycosyltransferase family 2 protein [Ignavibacteria bacterium]